MTGYPWSRGQTLVAEELNAAFVKGMSKVTIAPTPPVPANNPDGAMWWNSADGQLYILYDDGSSTQWVSANSAIAGPFLPLSGGTVNGQLTISPSANVPNHVTINPPNAMSASAPGQQFQSYLAVQTSGGAPLDIYANLSVNTSVQGATVNGIWGILSQMDYSGTGSGNSGSGHVPIYAQFTRSVVNAGGGTNNPGIWGAVFEVIDWTNTDSAQTNAMSGIELDMTVGNTDSARNRRGFGMYLNRANPTDAPPVVELGMHLASNIGSYNNILRLQSPFNETAIDLRTATATVGTAHQIWLGDNGTIAMDTNAQTVLSGGGGGTLKITGSASQPARVVYQPGSGVTSWWAGVWPDDSFYIAGPNGNAFVVAPDNNVHMLNSFAIHGATPPAKQNYGAATGTATRTTFVTSSVTLPVLAEHVKALIDDLISYGLIGP